jgi:hypothetical protein
MEQVLLDQVEVLVDSEAGLAEEEWVVLLKQVQKVIVSVHAVVKK